jgi:hypothetical protein
LRDKHKKVINQKYRKGVARYVTEKIEGIIWDKEQVIYPEPNSPPVDVFLVLP